VEKIELERAEIVELMAHQNAIMAIEARASIEKERHALEQRRVWSQAGKRIANLPPLGEMDFSNVDPVTFAGAVYHRELDKGPEKA
jgi:hypothetical protein